MKIERTHVGWGFWFWWVLASTVGWAVGNAAGMKVVQAVVGDAEHWIKVVAVATPLFVVMTGAAVGVMQWLVLRREVSGAGWWVLAIPVGWAVGLVVLGVIKEAVGLTVDLTVGLTVTFAVGGAVIGAVTGAVLVRLVRQPTATDLGASQAAE